MINNEEQNKAQTQCVPTFWLVPQKMICKNYEIIKIINYLIIDLPATINLSA